MPHKEGGKANGVENWHVFNRVKQAEAAEPPAENALLGSQPPSSTQVMWKIPAMSATQAEDGHAGASPPPPRF